MRHAFLYFCVIRFAVIIWTAVQRIQVCEKVNFELAASNFRKHFLCCSLKCVGCCVSGRIGMAFVSSLCGVHDLGEVEA
jgi:hypothetical protein